MLLTQDERRLLVWYVDRIGRAGELDWFHKDNQLAPLLKPDTPIPFALAMSLRIDEANSVLEARRFIELQYNTDDKMVGVTLTSDGHTMGRKLRTWYGRLDAWYRDLQGGIWFAIGAFILGWMLKALYDYVTRKP